MPVPSGPLGRWRRAPRSCGYTLLLMLMALPQAQAAAAASLRGIVQGTQSKPLAGATVTLAAALSQWRETARTGQDGTFVFATVPLGDYVLSVAYPGYVAASRQLTVGSGFALEEHIQLSSSLETVTVSAAPLSEALESATPTTLVSRDDIARTPGADRSNSLAMITDFVPGAYFVHDQLHVRGGHQTTWALDGVEIPNTNIASNLGPQIDPKDIAYLEVERGSYEADEGDRTYGVFNVVPRTGFERQDEAELVASGGNFSQTNDYLSVGSHTERLAYYASVNANRSDLGIEPPVSQVIHDAESGYGAFATLVFNAGQQDQLRLVSSVRRDSYEIPQAPGDTADDIEHEADAFAILSWVHTFDPDAVLTSAVFYHYNRADLDAAPNDFPISTTAQRASTYAGGQETLRLHWNRNDLQLGVMGFAQQDEQRFDVLFNDGSNPAIHQGLSPSGALEVAYIEDQFKPTRSLTLNAGVRQSHFSGGIDENATSPRVGISLALPRVNWVLRGFYGQFYQPPPLATLSGPLLQYASASTLGFLPLRGERDEERQFGVSIPLSGWMIDVDRFRTQAANFFDHNPIGNSNVFLPLTIDGAVIRGIELTVRSPKLWDLARLHAAYSNQTANGSGSINGGLTDFSPPQGTFALDHDQRNTVNVGMDADLPQQTFGSFNLYYGSGFANGSAPPSHLPSHVSLDLSIGRWISRSLSLSLTVLNLANRRLLLDNSLTFGGVHYDDPREIYAQVRYRFGY